MEKYYIASCVFSSQFPELSYRIQDYVRERFGMRIVRCCIPKYKLKDFEERFPDGELREKWRALPDSGDFQEGDEVFSLCHNCNNIIEEMHPEVHVRSLWELIDSDDRFPFPDYRGMALPRQKRRAGCGSQPAEKDGDRLCGDRRKQRKDRFLRGIALSSAAAEKSQVGA